MAKGDKFSLGQCFKIELEKKEIDNYPYSSTIGSLMYAFACSIHYRCVG